MKTVIYVYLESAEDPEEFYLQGKRSDFTYKEIVKLLHKKYGEQGWLTFTYSRQNKIDEI